MRKLKLLTAMLAMATGILLAGGCASGDTKPGEWAAATQVDWQLTQLHGQKPLDGTQPSVTFAEDGRLVGSGGANRFFGGYEVDPATGSLTIGALGSTLMFLDDPAGNMEQERLYLNTLSSVQSYRLQNGQLVLQREGKTILRFTPAPGSGSTNAEPRP